MATVEKKRKVFGAVAELFIGVLQTKGATFITVLGKEGQGG